LEAWEPGAASEMLERSAGALEAGVREMLGEQDW
jgi:hypothetical protein